MNHKKINNLLKTEVSRRQFLGMVAGTFVAAIGLNSLLSHLLSYSPDHSRTQKTGRQWGGGKFGV